MQLFVIVILAPVEMRAGLIEWRHGIPQTAFSEFNDIDAAEEERYPVHCSLHLRYPLILRDRELNLLFPTSDFLASSNHSVLASLVFHLGIIAVAPLRRSWKVRVRLLVGSGLSVVSSKSAFNGISLVIPPSRELHQQKLVILQADLYIWDWNEIRAVRNDATSASAVAGHGTKSQERVMPYGYCTNGLSVR